ncbi:MAG: restriction endonuclease subunit S, partial [Bacteroidetes bacterium]|nr:restriction endonuclease subunit S [Bacteroidota bacterium]
ANPPYISFGLRGVGKSDDSLRSIFPNSAEYKLSIYAIFIDKGTQLLQSQGILSYITPDSFLLVGRYFSKLRIHILNTCRIIKILMFEKDFWESGVVGRPVITILKGEPNTDLRKSNTPYYSLYHSLDDFNAGIVLSFSYPQKYFVTTPHNRFRLFFDERYKKIVDHIESGSSKLSDLVTIHTGVRSKIGQKNIISKAKEGKSWYKGLISGSEIDKYIIRHEGNFINIDPRILWSGGWNPKIILNDKLLIRQTGDSLIAAFDDNKYYHLNNLHSVSPKDAQTKTLKFVLSLLNSKLLDFYYHLISLETGRTMAQTDIETIELLPIKIPSSDIQNKIVSLVDRILAITSRPEFWQQGASAPNPEMQAKVKSLEQEIDQMVYKLYDLTEEEIKIVEGSGQQ